MPRLFLLYVAPLSLRSRLRQRGSIFSPAYPAFIPRPAQRNSGTHWANVCRASGALCIGGLNKIGDCAYKELPAARLDIEVVSRTEPVEEHRRVRG
jgi:hypothetical protein